MDYHVRAFLVSLTYDITIFLLGFLAFLFVRRYRGDPEDTAKAPLLFLNEGQEILVNTLVEDNKKQKIKFVDPFASDIGANLSRLGTSSYLGWFQSLFLNDKYFRNADIQRYLNFLKHSILLYGIFSVVGLGLILPLNLLAAHEEGTSFFDKAAAANAKLGTLRVAILYVCTWAAVLASYAIIISYHFQIPEPIIKTFRPEYFTVLVSNIDAGLTDPIVLKTRFEDIYPDNVVQATLVLDYTSKKTRRNPMGLRGTRLGFVSFSSTDVVRDCLRQRNRISFCHQIWVVEPAPPPEDLIWDQMHITTQTRTIRIVSLYLVLLFLSVAVLSVLPTTAMAIWKLLLVAPNDNTAYINNLKKFSEKRYFGFGWETLTSWLPPFLLYVANSLLLPLLVQWQSRLSGFWRRSSIAASIMRGNIVFLLIHTILIPLTSDTLMTLADVWAAAESNIDVTFWVRQTGELLLTNSASFALRYILDCTCISSISQLLQLPRLLLQCPACRHQTYEFDFGYWYAFGISMFALLLLLSVVSPLVLPLGVFFFTMKYFVDKYNFTHRVWAVEIDMPRPSHTGETAWMLFAVVLMQFAMAGFFFMIGQVWGGFALFIGCFVGLAAVIRVHAPICRAPIPGLTLTKTDSDVLKTAYIHPRQKELFKTPLATS